MPNRPDHVFVGTVAGLVATGFAAQREPTRQILIELVGGLVGGWLGGIAPDLLEPPDSPNHRSMAHSVAAGCAVTFVGISDWQAWCRKRARRYEEKAQAGAARDRPSLGAEMMAVLWRLLSGFLVGAAAGYASHLLLDAGTPRSLPLILR